MSSFLQPSLFTIKVECRPRNHVGGIGSDHLLASRAAVGLA